MKSTIKSIIKRIAIRWKEALSKKNFLLSLLIGFIFFIIALNIQFKTGGYADSVAASGTTDLILDFLPTLNLNWLFVYGYFFLIVSFVFYLVAHSPKDGPFSLMAMGLFVIIRSLFTILTHLDVPEEYIAGGIPAYTGVYFFTSDLFFSGHVGFPYLMSLLVKNKRLKYYFIAGSAVMALTVMFMHVHYSIDVFAAYFITYSIYRIAKRIF